MKRIFFAFAALLCIISSCTMQIKPDGMAGLRLSIAGNEEMNRITKSSEIMNDMNSFVIEIFNAETYELVRSYAYSELPDVINLDKGTYKVVVGNAGYSLPAFNTPVYRGEETIAIVPGEITSLKVVCSIINVKISLTLDKSFTDEVTDDYSVTVSTETGKTLIFYKENIAAGDAAFIEPSDFELIVKAIRKSNNESISKAYIASDVKPRNHYHFTVRAVATGTVDAHNFIEIDDTFDERDEDILVEGLEDDPIVDPDQPDEPDQPEDPVVNDIVITAPGIETPATYVQGVGVADGGSFVMSAEVPQGVEKFEVTVPSKELQGMLDAMDQAYTVDLANMEGEQLEFWGGLLGIDDPASEVKGKTHVDFNVTTFIRLMPVDTNVMQLKVTDKKGNVKSATVTIIITAK